MRILNEGELYGAENPADYGYYIMLPDGERPGFEKEVFEREARALKEGRSPAELFLSRIMPGVYSYLRAAHMFRGGTGAGDRGRYIMCLQNAYGLGSEEAGWELLEVPGLPGETIENPVPRATTVMSLAGGSPRRFLREAEARAKEHPEVAAAAICGLDLEGRTFDRFYALAGDSFRTDVAYRGYIERMRRQDRRTALEMLTEAVEGGSADAEAELGKAYFIGDLVPADRRKARRYLSSAAEKRNGYRSWLAMFRSPPPEGAVPDCDPDPDDRLSEGSRWPYPVLLGPAVPEWEVLCEICRRIAPGEGYADGTFEIRDLSAERNPVTDPAGYEMPDLRFKPTGYELVRQAFPFGSSRSNRPLDTGKVRHILRLCIQSAVAPEGEML